MSRPSQSSRLILLLLLALQPTVSFSLLSNSLPFLPFLTQLSPPSYSHYLHIVFNILNPSFPWSSSNSSNYWFPLLGVLFSTIRITRRSQAILLLFINLTISVILLVHSVRNSFWFSQMNTIHEFPFYFFKTHFQARSQNWENELLPSSCLSVRSHGTIRLPLDGFSWSMIFQYFSKICR
jgi:hypothetical protein